MANEDLDLDVDGEEEPPKSKKKLIIIIAAAVVLLILLGVGGFFMFSGGDEPVAQEGAAAEGNDAAKDEKAAPPEEEREILEENAIYWPVEPPFVMNFEGKSKAKYMQIKVVGMSRSQKSMAAFKKHMPAIRNELTFLFGSQKYVELSTPSGKEQLRAEIIETVNDIIKSHGGGRGLSTVYFTSFVMQ
ncbi:MAG: flagellar basal body-associated FliL family protein [Gammaproteobacteria bacterium]|nr:flagellar basal body-associated FliL family protein [Gammaproteobacteria bacterium]